MKVHHIGYLVKRIDLAVADFERLGYEIENLTHDYGNRNSCGAVIDNIRKIRVVFMKNGDYRVELVEPLGKESPIYGLLKKYKNSPYHICYLTADIENEIKNLEEQGWMLFEAPALAPAINNCNVAFLMSPQSGMLELVECSEDKDNGTKIIGE